MNFKDLIDCKIGNDPLIAYPWRGLADELILWSKEKSEEHRAFAFDLLMSLAYIDTISNLQKHFKSYSDLPNNYNLHLGFINLCMPLLMKESGWHYQKAAKPQSGAIGKLTSEVILRFIQLLFPNLNTVKSIGGVGIADAVLKHNDGRVILCEIKASPLTTYPFLFKCDDQLSDTHLSSLTRLQVFEFKSALYMHCEDIIELGRPKDDLWPFKPAIKFITDQRQCSKVELFINTWSSIRRAYIEKNRDSKYYYAANASGQPPKVAIDNYNWPKNESISDSKTSAGLDRTDDIKKGIYQTFKLSVEANRGLIQDNIRTALITNLPAYRHGEEYIKPFNDIYWGYERSFKIEKEGICSCKKNELKRPFDYIIALEDAFIRDEWI